MKIDSHIDNENRHYRLEKDAYGEFILTVEIDGVLTELARGTSKKVFTAWDKTFK